MLIKGSMVTEMSGSLGGITAARNKGGLYLRARSKPVNPDTVAQIAARTAMASLVSAWTSELIDEQRDGWRTYAANVSTTNNLGDAKLNSGQNWYVALNTPRVRSGLARVDDAPGTFAGATLNPVSLTVVEAGDTDIVFDDAQEWADTDGAALICQLSSPQNQSKVFFKGPFRFASLVEGDSTTPPASPATLDAPFSYVAGQKVFARCRLSLADGRLSAPQVVSAIVSGV